MTETIAEDPAVLAAYRPYAEKTEKVLAEVLTQATEPMPALNVTRHEVAVGQLLADAIRAHAKTDIALAASNQFNPRGLLKGPVKIADLYDLLPNYTRQHIVVLRAPGSRIREMVAKAFTGGATPVQISGFTIAGDQIAIAGQPLQDDKTYTISGPAHVLQDYFLGKPGVEIVIDSPEEPHVRDALIEFLRGHPPLNNAVEKRISK
jgi:2',3'-cyclic-nucleotide 2'-phosphodiesterase (5'-nucleotidase family)